MTLPCGAERYAIDLRDTEFDHFYAADALGGSGVEVETDHLNITTWKSGGPEQVVQKR